MNESNIKLAQKDIEEAVKTIEDLEAVIDNNDISKDDLKEKFISLNEKVQQLEDILKKEGIL